MRGRLPYQQTSRIHTISATNLRYGGGISGVGVTTGPEKVYLVFWGSQWGTQGTNGQGYATFSGDSFGMASDLQAFFTGLGTGGETWSGVMTQYCEGVATLAQACGVSNHVGYPTGGALAGVWEDTSAASPAKSSGNQIGTEAVAAAEHFGNLTQASNRNTQYVVISPTGTDPDGYIQNGFCAWHDYTGDSTLSGGAVSTPVGQLAFTNLPYLLDAGTSCGENFVNGGSAGTLDGVTIVEGHEYAETVTDQFPAGGWTDNKGNENGDKCAWIQSGQGAAQNISLTTGSFAVQSTWANDFNSGAGGCEVSHPIVSSGNTITVTNPGSKSSIVGSHVSLQVHAADSGVAQTITYGASGLPDGLSINTSTGLISGTPKAIGPVLVTVTATDTTTASGLASFSWTITSNGGIGVENGGFETGSLLGWSRSGPATSVTTSGPHTGSYSALLGSSSKTNGSSTISQALLVPGGRSKLHVWYNLTCHDTVKNDWATVTLQDLTKGTTKTILARTCVKASGWVQLTAAVTAGHHYRLTLTSHDDNRTGNATFTRYDDITLS